MSEQEEEERRRRLIIRQASESNSLTGEEQSFLQDVLARGSPSQCERKRVSELVGKAAVG